MSPGIPILTRRDVAAELKAIHGVRHRSLHTAFFGEADPDLLSNRVVVAPVEGSDARFQVEEVSSELHLRRALATAAPDTALALLLTYGDRVPLDVEARLARGGVRHIDRGRRLAARFEARSASPDLLAQKPLVDALLDLGRDFGKHPGLTADLDAGWRAFLGELTPLGIAPPSEDGVLAMVTLRAGGPAFAKRCQDWPGLRESLHAWLGLAAGPVAKVAWRAWEADEGLKSGSLTFLLQACAEGLGAGRHAYVRGLLKPILEKLDPDLRDVFADGAPLLRRWGGLADRLWLALQGIPGAAGDVLRTADDVLPRESEVDEALAPSPYLPRALALVRQRLATALTSAAQAPDRALIEAAMAAEKRFADHRLAQVEAERPALERARMALRLLAWRHRRVQGAEAIEARPPVEQAPAIAAAYAQEGGFVDRARQTLRGAGLDEFGKACAAVLEEVDALRDAQDERFARALDAWTSRGRPPGADRTCRFGAQARTQARPVAELTLSLPSVAPPVPAATPVPTPPPAVVELVSQSKMLSAMLAQRPRAKRDEVLRAVTVLAEAGGTLSPELFAARFGALSVRVPGLVSVLSEVLNVDGYPVLLLDHAAKVVRLDLGKLEAVFKG